MKNKTIKKYLVYVLLSSIFVSHSIFSYGAVTTNTTTNKNISLRINGEVLKTDTPPVIIDNRTLVPARAVFEKLGAEVLWDNSQKKVSVVLGSMRIELKINSKNSLINNKTVLLDVPAKIVNGRTMIPVRFVSEQLNMKVGWSEKDKLVTIDTSNSENITYRGDYDRDTTTATPTPSSTESPTPTNILDFTPTPTATEAKMNLNIQYNVVDSQDVISILITHYEGYKVSRVTDPDKLILDIPNSVPIAAQTLQIGSKLIKSIECKQADENTSRIILYVNGYPDFETEEQADRLMLSIKESTIKNITYHNHGDRVSFTLSGGTVLTDSDKEKTKLFTERYDFDGLQYTITYPSNLANLGNGTVKINDKFIDWIQIMDDNETGTTSMTFKTKEAYEYETITRRTYSDNSKLIDTAITLLKPASSEDKLVVIDAGHGGYDTGAIPNGFIEKNLNLDIALRLNALLKARNVKTYMIRENDIYVDLYERPLIANKLNATLFLSIHHNSFTSTAKGTETFYRTNLEASTPQSKMFADIIQQNLLAALNTHDRKVQTANFVVIRETKMPSALTELAFMSNQEDAAKILSEEFKRKAAEALCESIVQALSKL